MPAGRMLPAGRNNRPGVRMLTSRQKQIVGTLLGRDEFTPVSEIAATLGISGRTVLRELSALSVDLRAFRATVERKSSRGVRLQCPRETLQELTRVVLGKTKLVLCSKEERRRFILATLLQNGEPVKMQYFTATLAVTDATVGADLDRLDNWLEEHNIRLIRKPGVGVYLSGDEWSLRNGMLNLFFDAHEYQSIQSMLSSREALEEMAEQDILSFLDAPLLWAVQAALEAERPIRTLLRADKNYFEFLICAYYMIRRARQGHPFHGSPARMSEWIKSAEYSFMHSVLERLRVVSDCALIEDEMDYLMLQLQVTHGRSAYPEQTIQTLQPVIQEIIRIAESETGYLLENNGTFFHGLCEHLIPAVNRMRLHLEIKNPLLESVKIHYPQLYALASTCIAPIEREFSVVVPDPEIAYIAMYLGVALEDKNLRRDRSIRAIVCCPAGMVSAQFLATLLNREFPHLTIREIVATTNLGERLASSGVDIVISTVPIQNLEVPNITVSPFLLEEDRARLATELKAITRRPYWDQKLESGIKEKLSNVKNIIDGILQVLDSFFILDRLHYFRVQELIDCAAQYTGKTDEQKRMIAQSLLERERYGSTVDFSSGCMLLHCRTDGVEELHFGILRIDSSVLLGGEGQQIDARLILVMLAPMQCPSEHISVMGAISQGILNEAWLVQAFKTGDAGNCYLALERLMSDYQSDYFMITGKERS